MRYVSIFTCVIGIALCGGFVLTWQRHQDQLSTDTYRHLPAILSSEVKGLAAHGAVPQVKSLFTILNNTGLPKRYCLRHKSCSCATIISDDVSIAAVGQSLLIGAGASAEVTLFGRISERAGPYSFTALFEDEAYTDDRLELRIDMDVVADIKCEPATLLLANHKAQQVIVTHTARGSTKDTCRLSVDALPSAVSVKSIDTVPDTTSSHAEMRQQAWRVELNATYQEESDGRSAVARFKIESEESICHADLPIIVKEKASIRSPRSIFFGVTACGQTRERRCILASDDVFRVREALSSSDRFQVTVDNADARNRHWVTVCFKPLEAGEHRAAIKCLTDHPNMANLNVDVFGLGEASRASPSDHLGADPSLSGPKSTSGKLDKREVAQ